MDWHNWSEGLAMAATVEIRPEALALVLAYIAGGTIMNILRHQLPDANRSG